MTDDRPEGAPALVLASASPRRVELLGRLGLEPEVVPADLDESWDPGESPKAYVERVALDKARTVTAQRPHAVVLAADTAVVIDGEVLGKPADLDRARTMLEAMSGRSHDVLTAVALTMPDRSEVEVRTAPATVTLGQLRASEIDWYLATGEPLGKAGAYAIQGRGAALVERVDGDPSTVIGLPLRTAVAMLRSAGIRLPLG